MVTHAHCVPAEREASKPKGQTETKRKSTSEVLCCIYALFSLHPAAAAAAAAAAAVVVVNVVALGIPRGTRAVPRQQPWWRSRNIFARSLRTTVILLSAWGQHQPLLSENKLLPDQAHEC